MHNDKEFIVTNLKPAQKDKTRINVFINGRFGFSLTLEELSDAKIHVGSKLDPEELEDLKKISDFGKLYQRELEYALTRPHSEKEVRDHLRNKKFKREVAAKRYDEFVKRMEESPEYRAEVKELRQKTREKNEKLKSFEEDNRFEYRRYAKTGLPTKPGAPISDRDIERVVEKLKQNRVIDDEQFARYFVENRNRIKGTSVKKLKLELKAKGVDAKIIESVFATDEYGESLRDEREEIEKVIAKKMRKGMEREKLIQYLLRQGFPYDLVKDSLAEMDSQNSEQNLSA